MRFLFPIYRGRGFGRRVMSAGLFVYDFLARIPRSERHRILSAEEVVEMEPMLAHEGLAGGATYLDAWADDARVTLENAMDAAIHGAAVANYASVQGFSRSGERLAAASVRDHISGRDLEVRARLFVNAAGPWVDRVRRMEERDARACVRLTKGVHLVFPLTRLPVRNPLVLGDNCDRIVFVMPHGPYVLVGTTDTDFAGDASAVWAENNDVQYLLRVIRENLRGVSLDAGDVASSFAGLRALVITDAKRSPSSVPREEVLIESNSGMLTVAGGKLTTHREIAQKVVNRVLRRLGRPAGSSPTTTIPLPGARDFAGGGSNAESVLRGIDRETRAILHARYGSRSAMVARIIVERPELAAPLAPGCPAIGAEVVHAIRREMAQSLADFMVRRSSLVWRAPIEADAAASPAASIMAKELGWDRVREQAEVDDFVRDMKRRRNP